MDLWERFAGLGDEELKRILEETAGDYTPDALEIATEELATRGVTYREPSLQAPELQVKASGSAGPPWVGVVLGYAAETRVAVLDLEAGPGAGAAATRISKALRRQFANTSGLAIAAGKTLDPAWAPDRVVLVSHAAVALLSLFDGQRDRRSLAAEFARRHGDRIEGS